MCYRGGEAWPVSSSLLGRRKEAPLSDIGPTSDVNKTKPASHPRMKEAHPLPTMPLGQLQLIIQICQLPICSRLKPHGSQRSKSAAQKQCENPSPAKLRGGCLWLRCMAQAFEFDSGSSFRGPGGAAWLTYGHPPHSPPAARKHSSQRLD